MRSVISILWFLLVHIYYSNAQSDACKCIANEKTFNQIENLFVEKDYEAIQLLLEKTSVKSSICQQEKLCYQLQLFVTLNKTDKADSIATILQQIPKQKNCSATEIKYHFQIGNYFLKKEKTDAALQQFLLVKEMAEQTKDTTFQIKSISRIAFLFNKMQQPQKAIEYDYEQLALAQQKNDPKLILQAYTQMQGHFGIWYDITSEQRF